MSSNDAAQLAGAARHITSAGLIAIAWTGVVVAAFFVALRCYARLTEIQRLHPDDYWMMAALTFLIINAILQTLQSPSLYYLVFVSVGRVPAGEPLLVQGNIYVRYEFAIIGLFWTILWCVKASFLSLFYRLFDGLPTYRKLWWATVSFVILAYAGDWIASVYTCHPPSTYFQFGQCEKPIDVRGGNISISYSTAVDILSDIFIMVLPLRLLPKLQVSQRQKIGLGAIFCVGMLVIASAIVRLTQIIGQERSDPVGLAVWGLVESSVSVIVGSLPPLKNMLGRKLNRTRRGYSPYADTMAKSNARSRLPKQLSADNSKAARETVVPVQEGLEMTTTSEHSHDESKGQPVQLQNEMSWVRIDSEAGSGHEHELEHEPDRYDEEARIIGVGK